MKRFMIRFQGHKCGWAGRSEIYTITVAATFYEQAVEVLVKTHIVEKVNYYRELKK